MIQCIQTWSTLLIITILCKTIALWIVGMFFILYDKKLEKGRLIGNLFTITGTLVIIVFVIITY